MSASKQKKFRQDDSLLTEKQRKEQLEAAASKRDRVIYTVIGVVAAVAVIALLVWDSGLFQRRAVAATIGGKDYTVAEVDYYYNQSKSNFINTVQYYQQYGLDMGYDVNKTPAEQVYSTDATTGETMTYHDFFQESALNTLQQVAAITAAAEAEGYTLSEAGLTSLQSQDKQVDDLAAQYNTNRKSILKSLYGSYITEGLFQTQLERSILASDYMSHYESGLDTSDDTLNAYYEANAADLNVYTYRYASILGTPETATDADGKEIAATEEETAAALADAKARADAMLAAVESGENFDAIAKDYVSADDREAYAAEDYTLRTGSTGTGLSAIYQAWMTDAARKAGDTAVFENGGDGYVLVQYVSQQRDETTNVNVRHILVKPESDTENATEFTAEQWAAAEEKARGLHDKFLSGAQTAEAFGLLAEASSEDGRDADGNLTAPGGEYANVAPGRMDAAFDAWIFDAARTAGETGLVKSQFGWHIIYFEGRNEPNWKNSAKTALLDEKVTAWVEEQKVGFDIVKADGMAHVG